ncbi:hypothetical protein TESG_04501 [Trichophyton tonsurans CBS 112818]|uniref:Uncharacterized protein n=1 Tax=Trichophyton tonsurans (strain CBS 112818) TaxID=647933 RepID=F2S0I3_TRIT1|nr:hypothetical protein TESG_04501 [Trichophyton tonsurans CBS 112818]
MGALSRLLPVILVILLVVALAAIGLVIYSIAMDVKDNTKKKMEKKNVAFSREGAKVGVKEMQAEEYQDRTQSVLVNMWENSRYRSDQGKEEEGLNIENTEMGRIRSADGKRVTSSIFGIIISG